MPSGLGVRVIAVFAAAVIMTVLGLLWVNGSLTISWATYVPTTSATNVGDELLAPESVAVLPLGRLSSDHE